VTVNACASPRRNTASSMLTMQQHRADLFAPQSSLGVWWAAHPTTCSAGADVLVSEKWDLAATRRFFARALEHGTSPLR
jgi:hypothetical protein